MVYLPAELNYRKLLWFALTILAFCGAVFCALSQFNRYSSEPVVVSLQRDYTRWWTTFPAVTACFIERVDPEKAKEAIEKIWNVTEDSDPEKFQYYNGFISLIADVSFRNNLQNFWKFQTDDSVKNVDLGVLALSVHPNFTLSVIQSQHSEELQWIPVMTEDGLCHSYNSIYAEYQFAVKDGHFKADQLLKCHYHNAECFVKVESSVPVRFFIHSPFDITTAISNPTGELTPGELVMDFKTVEIQASSTVKTLQHEQRRCWYPDEWISDSITAYSFGLCQMHCRTKMALMFCGCRPYFFSKGVLPFGIEAGLLSVAAYHFTKLKKPNPRNVVNIFGPDPRSMDDNDKNQSKVVQCIAHRGAGLDAPENTLEAFKYCVERDCNFIEMDVRSVKDGKLVLLHDQGLQRISQTSISNVRNTDWDVIKDIDVGARHPNRDNFKSVHLCLLDDALDYLLSNKVRMILDVKGEDKEVINGIVNAFKTKPELHKYAAVTCFNPVVLYQIRRQDPEIVGAISYRPYSFSSANYDAESGPTSPRMGENVILHGLLRAADALHAASWRWAARWCAVSCVLLHKDIVSLSEVQFWRSINVRCIGWSVNRPLEKLYWRGVLKAPYLANTLVGEADVSEVDRQRSVGKSVEAE